ncbi:MAG TPA: hypothetical protein VF516_46310, partial [Kofleriaceae bacterium]
MPRPRRPGGRVERDREDEANEWAMMFTMKDADVARLCDRMPMTLDPVLQLARRCGVPPVAAAVRLMGVTVRFCAAVLSQDGVIQRASPSLRLLGFMDVSRFPEGKPIGAGALARRFVDTGRLRRDPDLVPASAWIDGVSDDTWIRGAELAPAPAGAAEDAGDTPGAPPRPRVDPWRSAARRTRLLDPRRGRVEAARRAPGRVLLGPRRGQ